MFNEELKRRYIEEKNENVTVPSNYLERQFTKVEKVEEELGKDVHDFTVYEIIEYYKTMNIVSLESLAVLNSHFSMYTQWCLQENIVKDNQNHFLEIDLEQLKGCLNTAILEKKIVDRKQVIDWCEQLPNPKDQVIMLGLFEGIKGGNFSEFVNLKPSNVSESSDIILLTDTLEKKYKNTNLDKDNEKQMYEYEVIKETYREITVSKQLIKYIKNSIEETTYYSCKDLCVKTMPLIDKGCVIKYYPNTTDDTSYFQKGRIIYNCISRSLKYVGALQYMSANSLAESGKINMIKERSKELGMTARDYIYSNYIEEVEHQYGCKIVKSTFWLKYADYLE